MKKISFIIIGLLLTSLAFSQKYIGKEKTVTANAKLNELYCSGLFKSEEGTILDVANDNSIKGYLNILDWLKGRVAGVQIYYTKWGTPVPFIRNQRAVVFIDEMQVDASALNSLPVGDVAMIKVIKQPFLGSVANGGAIAVYTFKADEKDEEPAVAKN